MIQTLINSIAVVVLGAFLTFLTTYWFVVRKRISDSKAKADTDHEALLAKVNELTNKLALVESTVTPIASAFQAVLIAKLTHFHTPEMDALLVKLQQTTLTNNDRNRLTILLEQRIVELNGDIDTPEREAAIMIPMVNRMVVAASISSEVTTQALQVVALPVAPEDTEDATRST